MKGHLDSGETYSLEQIFVNGTNGKMVIPDLQRDYCWGGKGTLVIDFVNNIKPKSVIRISLCRKAARNPLFCPKWRGKTSLFLKTWPDKEYVCLLSCPNKPVWRSTRNV